MKKNLCGDKKSDDVIFKFLKFLTKLKKICCVVDKLIKFYRRLSDGEGLVKYNPSYVYGTFALCWLIYKLRFPQHGKVKIRRK